MSLDATLKDALLDSAPRTPSMSLGWEEVSGVSDTWTTFPLGMGAPSPIDPSALRDLYHTIMAYCDKHFVIHEKGVIRMSWCQKH
eukprot:1461071-Amphidinium_carterae.2